MDGISYLFYPVASRGSQNEVGNNLAISRSAESIALVDKFGFKMGGIDYIAVMGKGNSIGTAADQDGLSVIEPAGTGGRIAIMTDGDIAVKLG